MEKPVKIFATGLTGFIGRHVLPLLLERRYEVYALTRQEQDENTGICWRNGDFFDRVFMRGLLEEIRPEYLLHLAWDVTPGYQVSERNYDWLWASFNLWMDFVRCGGKRAVFAGTCFEYDWNHECCEEDITPLRPSSTYGVCKNVLLELVRCYAQNRDVTWSWGRIFYPFGSGEQTGRFFSSLIRAALSKEPVIVKTGQQVRDFVYVKDVAAAFILLLEADVCGVFNIASGEPRSRAFAAKELCGILKCVDRLEVKTLASTEPNSFFADMRKMNNLGWHPKYSLEKALREILFDFGGAV
jgi:nucleoside-diphosphate-sugar epimerase